MGGLLHIILRYHGGHDRDGIRPRPYDILHITLVDAADGDYRYVHGLADLEDYVKTQTLYSIGFGGGVEDRSHTYVCGALVIGFHSLFDRLYGYSDKRPVAKDVESVLDRHIRLTQMHSVCTHFLCHFDVVVDYEELVMFVGDLLDLDGIP